MVTTYLIFVPFLSRLFRKMVYFVYSGYFVYTQNPEKNQYIIDFQAFTETRKFILARSILAQYYPFFATRCSINTTATLYTRIP